MYWASRFFLSLFVFSCLALRPEEKQALRKFKTHMLKVQKRLASVSLKEPHPEKYHSIKGSEAMVDILMIPTYLWARHQVSIYYHSHSGLNRLKKEYISFLDQKVKYFNELKKLGAIPQGSKSNSDSENKAKNAKYTVAQKKKIKHLSLIYKKHLELNNSLDVEINYLGL